MLAEALGAVVLGFSLVLSVALCSVLPAGRAALKKPSFHAL